MGRANQMHCTSELHTSGSSPLNGVHSLQAHLCFRSIKSRSGATSRVLECCSRRGQTKSQICCDTATGNYKKNLRQQAGAVAANLLLSAGLACAPAEAYNVRLQDVENKAMQAGMQATDAA